MKARTESMADLPRIFDRARVARHLVRRQAPDDFILPLVLADLDDRLMAVTRRLEAALILAPAIDALPTLGRTAEGAFSYAHIATMDRGTGETTADPEQLVLPRTDYDLIVSLFDLGITNDVVGFLARLRAHLRPDGLLIAVTPGGLTLSELREAFIAAEAALFGGASPRVAPMIPLQDAASLLQRVGLALPVTDVETHKVRYAHPLRLMAELKALGAQNPLADRPAHITTRGLIAKASEIYAERFSDPDGRVRATLELVWMSGWAPHESQQKPARRGSATISLKDVLEKKA
jgi:hypothetical protein